MLNDPYKGPGTPSEADPQQVLLKKIAYSLDEMNTDGGGSGGGGGSSSSPYNSAETGVDVTATETVVVAAVATGQIVNVENNGPDDIWISEGGTPVADTAGAGSFNGTGRGQWITAGGNYSSDQSITCAVNAICRTGETAHLTVDAHTPA